MNIKDGFRTTGIYPIDRNTRVFNIRKSFTFCDASKSGLHFLPLCSPLPCAQGLETSGKLPVFTQEQLQRFEKDLKLRLSQMSNTSFINTLGIVL